MGTPPPLKRHYLRFFYESFIVDNKKIIEVKLTPIFKALPDANMVRLRHTGLERWDDYRRIDWASELEYSEFIIKEINRFLQY